MSKDSDIQDSVNPNYQRKTEELLPVKDYVKGIRKGDRTILSRAITLVESSRPEHCGLAHQVLEQCIQFTGNTLRIGVTGVPGAGKSTFIEALGDQLISKGHKIAVLTVDPSSSLTKGSILGDKTRMPNLSTSDMAYIRPSPTAGSLGGVARKTREAMLLCEAAGFDRILLETVGVGQSETAVHSMTDFFLLILISGAGDELQGIKRGVMEMADLIAINKAEGKNLDAAKRAKREYENALSLFPSAKSGWKAPVLTCSALNNSGIDDIWNKIEEYADLTLKNGYFKKNRAKQAVDWMHNSINQQLRDRFYNSPEIKKKLKIYEEDVMKGKTSSFSAAADLLKIFG